MCFLFTLKKYIKKVRYIGPKQDCFVLRVDLKAEVCLCMRIFADVIRVLCTLITLLLF